MKLHGSDNKGGIIVKTYTKSTCSHIYRERAREREENTLLHMDKDLSTIRLSCKSVADDKHSNNQYIKQEYNELCGGKNDLKTKLKLISV